MWSIAAFSVKQQEYRWISDIHPAGTSHNHHRRAVLFSFESWPAAFIWVPELNTSQDLTVKSPHHLLVMWAKPLRIGHLCSQRAAGRSPLRQWHIVQTKLAWAVTCHYQHQLPWKKYHSIRETSHSWTRQTEKLQGLRTVAADKEKHATLKMQQWTSVPTTAVLRPLKDNIQALTTSNCKKRNNIKTSCGIVRDKKHISGKFWGLLISVVSSTGHKSWYQNCDCSPDTESLISPAGHSGCTAEPWRAVPTTASQESPIVDYILTVPARISWGQQSRRWLLQTRSSVNFTLCLVSSPEIHLWF